MELTKYQRAEVARLVGLKAELAMLTLQVKAIQTKVIGWMEDSNISSIEINGKAVTIVRSKRSKFDAKAARNVLTDQMFEHVTERVVDSTKLKACVKAGLISPTELAWFEHTSDTAPYLRVS